MERHCPFRWTRVTRTLETRLRGHKLYEDYRNDNTKISDSIFKEKRRSNTCTPCYFGIPLSSRTLYIKYHSWSFLLVMVKIFTKTFLIFVHCGRIPFYELHPITFSFALSIIIPPLRSVFTRFPFSESFVWSTCVTKSISLFVWLIFRLMVRDLCASWRNIESYTILESYQYLFIKTRLFTL